MEERQPAITADSVLFTKYMSGEAEPEEVLALEDWLARSPSNKLLFEQFMKTWSGFHPENAHKLPDKEATWEALNEKIAQPKVIAATGKSSGWYLAAAAIAGIILMSVVSLLVFKHATDSRHVVGEISLTSSSAGMENKLPDGSSVVLGSNSSLKYPQQFKAEIRETALEGEGYFSIQHDPRKPFVIRYEDINIQVLGTSFFVRKLAEQGIIETQVSTGVVKMFNATDEVIITAGQTGTFNKQTNSFLLKDSLDINSFSYATRKFVFTDEALSSIIRYLEKSYDKKIVLENNKLANCTMTSSFDNKPIEYILDVIASTLDITYSIKGDTIYIRSDHEGC